MPFLEKRIYNISSEGEKTMQIMVAILGICAAAMLAWYVYILMKGDDKT